EPLVPAELGRPTPQLRRRLVKVGHVAPGIGGVYRCRQRSEQIRERLALPAQALFRQLLLGDVARYAQEARRLPGDAAHHAPFECHPPLPSTMRTSGRMHHPVLCVRNAALFVDFAEERIDTAQVLRLDEALAFLERLWRHVMAVDPSGQPIALQPARVWLHTEGSEP